MTKLRLGTVGTSWITEQFIEAAIDSERYSFEAVYSRSKDKATSLKKKFSAEKIYTNWENFLNDSNIDVIYIASPNSLHFEQTKDVLKNNKHAIVEKPLVVSLVEWSELIILAKKKEKVIVETARHIVEPNFIKTADIIKNMPKIYGASLSYSSYSSRYDNVLAGEEPNIFSSKFGGGATNDLGIYVVYAALYWFGKPKSVHAFIQKIETGVDGKGTVILRYDEFDVTLDYSKISTSTHKSEIYGPDHTVTLNAITNISEVDLVDVRTGEINNVSLDKPSSNPLLWEAYAFAEVIQNNKMHENKIKLEQWWELSKIVHEVLEEIRNQTI